MVKVANKWEEQVKNEPCEAIMQEFAHFPDPEKSVRDYVKKLMGRLVFLQFLQKKGWLGVRNGEWGSGDAEFLQTLYKNCDDKDHFVDKVLEELFNELNTEHDVEASHFKVPYLNGGLFEREATDETEFPLPAKYMQQMLDFFASYNFTIDENDPDDAEVGVDPEMLGRIFENLLEDNKDKGAFYTPKEIVTYMCRESLIAYLQTDIEDEEIKEAIRQFVTTHEKNDKLPSDIDQKLKDVKICDPAIGSGAFPMGLLKELFQCRTALEGIEQSKAAEIKKHIIQNNIYGVDIERGAVDIARLRFWLSLIVDEETPQALPNLDYKIVEGNSLITTFDGQYIDLERGKGEARFRSSLINIQKEKKLLQEEQKRFFTLTGDEKYRSEIAIKKHILNTIWYQLDFEKHSWQDATTEQAGLFGSIESKGRKKNKAQVAEFTQDRQLVLDKCEEMIAQLNDESKSLQIRANTIIPFFEWNTVFSELFDEKENRGFDIVIGNPPYVQLSKQPNVSDVYKKILKETYGTSGGRLNLFIFMLHQAMNIANSKGVVTFIIPNTILTQEYYKDTRELILKYHLRTIVSYNDMEFDNAVVENVTLITSKDSPLDYTVSVYTCKGMEVKLARSINVERFKKQKGFTFNINSNDFIDKLFENTVPLSSLCNINQAIALKGDKSLSVKTEYSPKYYKFLDGRNINRYAIEWTGLYLDYSLERIHSCKRKDIFECKEKLLFRRVSSNLIATYDDNQYFALNTLVVITPKIKCDLKYILALFNSKLMNYVYKNKFKSTKTVFSEIQARSVGELPIKISDIYESEIINHVDNILSIKKINPQADSSALESEVDLLVYRLYNLTYDEVLIVDPETPITREEYEKK